MAIKGAVLSQHEAQLRLRASIAALAVGLLIMIYKFWAFNITNSQAVFSDAVESIVNVVAALISILVMYYSSKPRDVDHPYGHGKIEYFSAAFEGGLIAFAALVIISESIVSLWQGAQPRKIDLGILMVASAGLGNLVLGYFLIRRGRGAGSTALVASGKHVMADFWTSAGLVVGLGLVMLTGWKALDPILALIVALHLCWTGFQLVKSSVGGLMDAEDLSVLESLREVFSQHLVNGIIQIHHVKVIRSGWYHHIDAHLVLPEFWDITQAHEKMNEFEKKVIKSYPFGGEMNFHLDPCRRAYCQVCDLKDCPIRREQFVSRMPVLLDDLRNPQEPQKFLERRSPS